jgi:hypothetical protein
MSRAINTPQWYRVTVPAAQCGTQAQILQNDFETLFTINGAPNGAALFTSHDAQCQNQFFYFSPGAVAIARGLIQHFAGQPCPPPVSDSENLKLLVGRTAERDVLLKSDDALKPRAKRKLDRILGRE